MFWDIKLKWPEIKQIAFGQLRRALQQLQTGTKITGATSLLWPHISAPVPQHRACKHRRRFQCPPLLVSCTDRYQRQWGHLQSLGRKSGSGAVGWEPLSWPQLTCPALSSAECPARWISRVLESSIRRAGIKSPCFLLLCKSMLSIRSSDLPITSAVCLLDNAIQRNLTLF